MSFQPEAFQTLRRPLENRLRVRLLFGLLLLLGLAQALNGLLSLRMFERLHLEAVADGYRVVAADFQDSLENALRFGKSLEKFVGMEQRLRELKRRYPKLHDIRLADARGRLLYGLRPASRERGQLAPALFEAAENNGLPRIRGIYHLPRLLRAPDGQVLGLLDFSFARERLGERNSRLILDNLKVLGAITLAAALLLALGLWWLLAPRKTGRVLSRHGLWLFLLSVLVAAQGVYTLFNLNFFQRHYAEILQGKTRTVGSLLQYRVETLLARGVALDRLVGMEAILEKFLTLNPELALLRVLDQQGHVLYQARRAVPLDLASRRDALSRPIEYRISSPPQATGESGADPPVAGYLRLVLSPAAVARQQTALLQQALWIGLLSLLCGGLLLNLLFYLMRRHLLYLEQFSGTEAEPGQHQAEMRRNLDFSLRLRILGTVLLLLLVAQGFSGGLNLASFEKLYLDSLISSYQVQGRDLQRNIENALRFGKSLEHFVGMDSLLREVQEHSPSLADLVVAKPDGEILHSLRPDPEGGRLPPELRLDQAGTPLSGLLLQDVYYNLLPLRRPDGRLIGLLALSFEAERVRAQTHLLLVDNLKILGLTTLFAALVLLAGLHLSIGFQRARDLSRVGLFTLLLLVLGGAQLTYAAFSADFFRQAYLEVTRDKVTTLGQLLREDIEYLLDKGIRLDRLVKIERLLAEILAATPEIGHVAIVDARHNLLYIADSRGTINMEQQALSPSLLLSLGEKNGEGLEFPLHSQRVGEGRQLEGYLKAQLSARVIRKEVFALLLDALTVTVVSFLFVMELAFFMFLFIYRQLSLIDPNPPPSHPRPRYGGGRPAAFLYMLGATLPYSFLPLYMEQLYQPLPGLSKDFLLGLPISVEMFFGGIVLIPVGIWIDRRGWQEPFLMGLILSLVGLIGSALAQHPLEFIAARAIMGLGYGFSWMSLQGFVLQNTPSEHRARGIANLVAGIFAGTLCGGAVGAMLAQRLGYAPVFLVGAGLMVLVILFTLVFMREHFTRAPAATPSPRNRVPLKRFFAFLFERNMFLVLMCSLLPYAICMVGMLYYISPVYLNRLGVSQSDIGRAMMIFGLCMIYIAPLISRLADRVENKKVFISLGGLLGTVAMLSFYFLSGFWAVLASILLLGISVSISAASRNVFVLNLPISREIGMARTMGVYRTVDKLGQTLGPILLGLAVATLGINQAVVAMGLGYALLTLFFVLGVVHPERRGEEFVAKPTGDRVSE